MMSFFGSFGRSRCSSAHDLFCNSARSESISFFNTALFSFAIMFSVLMLSKSLVNLFCAVFILEMSSERVSTLLPKSLINLFCVDFKSEMSRESVSTLVTMSFTFPNMSITFAEILEQFLQVYGALRTFSSTHVMWCQL